MSVHRGEYLTRYPPGPCTPPQEQTPLEQTPPWDQVHPPTRADTPWDQVHPPEQTPPPGPGTPPGADTPHLGADTPPRSRHPPGADPPLAKCMLGDTVNARAVRILLECNLVCDKFSQLLASFVDCTLNYMTLVYLLTLTHIRLMISQTGTGKTHLCRCSFLGNSPRRRC